MYMKKLKALLILNQKKGSISKRGEEFTNTLNL